MAASQVWHITIWSHGCNTDSTEISFVSKSQVNVKFGHYSEPVNKFLSVAKSSIIVPVLFALKLGRRLWQFIFSALHLLHLVCIFSYFAFF